MIALRILCDNKTDVILPYQHGFLPNSAFGDRSFHLEPCPAGLIISKLLIANRSSIVVNNLT
ncbi:MAG: hypothetical protein IJ470_05085 [Clostridia bacterium]|nr:hypothetical protein [Clostridia bacterium]